MPAVAINTKYVPLPGLSGSNFLKAGVQGEFRIESTLQYLPIDAGDGLIFIKPQNKDLLFTNLAIVDKVGEKRFIKGTTGKGNTIINQDHYEHYFNFEVEKTLTKNNRLSELEFSLPVIENYHKPEVHFQSQFRTLPNKDFDTIVNGWVYATRTVFGKLVNALPRQNKLEFMIQAMDHFSTIDFRETALVDGLEFLYQYIDRRILSRGRLLVATDGIIKKELDSLLPPEDIGFIDPETRSVQNISTQAKIFKSLFDIEKQKSLKKSLQETIKNNQALETRFQKMFNRRLWPVDLEK
jgi:hypothetical protein